MGPLAALRSLCRHMPSLNFITIHYCYFVVVCLISSVIFWASSNPHGQISYVDSLFVVVSAMTEAGLNTVNLSTMTTWQQTMLFLLIIFGSSIWVSIWTVLARKSMFRRRFLGRRQAFKGWAQERSLHHNDSSHRQTSGHNTGFDVTCSLEPAEPDRELPFSAAEEARHASPLCSSPCVLSEESAALESEEDGAPDGKRRHACGCELHALELLSVVVPLYFFLWQLLGCLGLGAWMHVNMPYTALANGINPFWLGVFNGVSAFNNSGMSLLDANMIPFQEADYVLITMGLMILAGNTAYPIFLRLIFWSAQRILNLTTRSTSFQRTKLAINLLLKDPRRVYTNLFPSRLTWWLLFMVICLNTADWVLFELLNLHNPVVGNIPVGPRVLVGLFQALAVRSGGFYVVPIAQISIGVQFLYVIMMYIAVYPVVITIRQSNVYSPGSIHDRGSHRLHDESAFWQGQTLERCSDSRQSIADPQATSPHVAVSQNLGSLRRRASHSATTENMVEKEQNPAELQTEDNTGEKRPTSISRPVRLPLTQRNRAPPGTDGGHMSFIHQQVHGQLAHDIWWLVLAILVIVIIESSHFNADPVGFSVFNIIFEVVSAYGTVGISVGVPVAAYSFAGAWYTGSKLVLCLVMLKGRHRGLPVALDRAIELPGHQYKHK